MRDSGIAIVIMFLAGCVLALAIYMTVLQRQLVEYQHQIAVLEETIASQTIVVRVQEAGSFYCLNSTRVYTESMGSNGYSVSCR